MESQRSKDDEDNLLHLFFLQDPTASFFPTRLKIKVHLLRMKGTNRKKGIQTNNMHTYTNTNTNTRIIKSK
jgi:hypothetical protein